jgi:integrase
MANKQDPRVRWDQRRGCYVARLVYRDELGNKREIRRQVDTITEGRELLRKMEREIGQHGPRIIDGAKLLFSELADLYEKEKLVEPVYEDNIRVAGLRSYKSLKRRLKTLVAHFGARRVATIRHGDILKFKLKRLRDKNKRDAQLGVESTPKLATVQRELQLMRNVLNYAKRQGWLVINPFEQGESLISMAAERQRDRILTREEEKKLLDAFNTPYRKHAIPLVIAAIDTGLRKGELLKLRWHDADLLSGVIRLRATTTKTEKARTVGLTQRLWDELQRLWDISPKDPKGLVFGISSDIKRGWKSACKDAGITDLRFHDLRHVMTTRLVETKALHTQEAMKITGHTQERTFRRYVNPADETARRGAEALDEWLEGEAEPERSELIN